MVIRMGPSGVRRYPLVLLLACCAMVVIGGGRPASAGQAGTSARQLFDGTSLAGWTPTKFYAPSDVSVEEGRIVLAAGKDLTGVTWTGGPLPSTNYELTLEAMRVAGNDFFAGITFPVGESFCSLILGGWGGTVVGLSSINRMDASENDTSQ